MQNKHTHEDGTPFTKEEFLQKLKTDREFNNEFGNKGIDQISELIRLLKETPDSRRMVVNAWAVHDLPKMVLPPCHYGFQVYTRELSDLERWILYCETCNKLQTQSIKGSTNKEQMEEYYREYNIPTRAISLMWNQRSVDTFLGLPFNIASYGLLLEIIAKMVNMVPDELIGNLGDTHLYLNHVEQAKEQIGRELSIEERINLAQSEYSEGNEMGLDIQLSGSSTKEETQQVLDYYGVPKRTREPYPLPKLNINTEFWLTESGECGVGNLTENFESLIEGIQSDDFTIENYKSHPKINAPLSN